ncbi:MAG TPA: HAD family hydrolase [Symbiobacteriaceae bacterium]|nr:HAD family hydrolase [Symbiobacteriaceae bacterium]
MQPYRGHAFVDWDDTVAENIRYFRETERQLAELIAAATNYDVTEIHHRGEELDVAVARRMGLVKDSFSTAWTECYREFVGRAGVAADVGLLREIYQLCQIPYETLQEILPGAAETLTWLHAIGFEVTIWTAGEERIQKRKVQDSGLQTLIHRVEVTTVKSPERLLGALGGRDRSRAFVVGNSAHSDIQPALAVGLPAFHIAVETWGYDKAKVDLDHPQYTRIESLAELPKRLEERFPIAL